MEKEYINKVLTTTVFFGLIVLSFFILKPILLSIITGLILAFIFAPVYNRLLKKFKNKNFTAGFICFFLITILLLPVWFLTPLIVNQSIKIYLYSQQVDFVSILQKISPSVFASDTFSQEIGPIIHSFITNITNSLMNYASTLILNFPTIFLQFIVIIFIFFFALKDGKEFINYIKSLLPFSKEIQEKIFTYSKEITNSVIYGQIVIGILQGVIVGIGFLIFGVPNALFLTLLALLAGIFPIIGTAIIWLPLAIYLLISGSMFSAIGISIFGLISNTIDNFIRPVIVSRKTNLKASVVFVGMIGGLFLFGILGFIIGPLILSYLLILLELYRGKPSPNFFVQE